MKKSLVVYLTTLGIFAIIRTSGLLVEHFISGELTSFIVESVIWSIFMVSIYINVDTWIGDEE